MKRRRGFSLLEVLLAIALIGLLSGSVVGFIFQLTERRGVLLEHSRRLIAADAMMDAIEGDVFTCLAGDGRRGAGVKGDATTLRVLSRSVQLGMDRTAERMARDDLRSTEYRFDAGRGEVSAARASVLFADEGSGGGRETILEGVERVRFRYYDGREWRERFDSAAAGKLPAAIEVGVWFGAPQGSQEDAAAVEGETGAESAAGGGESDEMIGMEAEPEETGSGGLEEDLPPPDRLRIIVVPDSGEDGAGTPPPPEGGAL